MKRLLKWSLMAVTALTLTSCDDAENSYETLGILPMDAYHLIYADQSIDSIQVVSTRNWEGSLTANWLKMDDLSGQTDGKMYSKTLPVFFDANLTDKVRTAYLLVKSGKHSVSHTFLQLYWLNITDPEPVYDYKEGNYPQDATFTKTIPAAGGSVSLSCHLYSPDVEVSADKWISIQAEDSVLDAGSHSFEVICSANGTGAPRTGHVNLKTKSGIVTSIVFHQKN